jgi:hypothetical protein
MTEMKPLVPEHHRNKAIWSGTFSMTEMKHFGLEPLLSCVPEQLQ